MIVSIILIALLLIAIAAAVALFFKARKENRLREKFSKVNPVSDMTVNEDLNRSNAPKPEEIKGDDEPGDIEAKSVS